MKTQAALFPDVPMVQALARGVCPICTLARVFQNAMVDAQHRYSASKLCNFHAWLLAHASPAVEAIPILRSMLTSRETLSSDPVQVHICNWCDTLREFEDEKMGEYIRRLHHENFRTWVSPYGTVCLFHGQRLMNKLSGSEAELVRHILASNKEELERQLWPSTSKCGGVKEAVVEVESLATSLSFLFRKGELLARRTDC